MADCSSLALSFEDTCQKGTDKSSLKPIVLACQKMHFRFIVNSSCNCSISLSLMSIGFYCFSLSFTVAFQKASFVNGMLNWRDKKGMRKRVEYGNLRLS